MLYEILIGVLAFIVGFALYASLFEWVLHKFIMHRPVRIGPWKFDYAFNAHAKVHHHVFGFDHTYHLQNPKDTFTIPMAWWNGPVLIAVGSIPFIITGFIIGHVIALTAGGIAGCTLYYLTYESIHWCMHKPSVKQRLIERSWFFRRLNGHHVLHHRYQHRNFNVVFPIWDLILGTLRIRSKIKFPQVRGPSVPDVQPLE